MATWHMCHHTTFLILFSSPTSPRTRFQTHRKRHKMPMIPVVLKPHQMHLTENDTNKEAEDEQDTGNGPIQPSVTECTARRRTAHKMKGRRKCMFGCLIDFASLGSSFSPSPSPSPIPTPSHTLPPLLLLRLLPRLPPLCLPPPLPLLLLLSLHLHCSSHV